MQANPFYLLDENSDSSSESPQRSTGPDPLVKQEYEAQLTTEVQGDMDDSNWNQKQSKAKRKPKQSRSPQGNRYRGNQRGKGRRKGKGECLDLDFFWIFLAFFWHFVSFFF